MLDPAVRRAIFGEVDPDVAIEATLAAALGEALRDRRRALEALE